MLESEADIVVFGGQAGGGKSFGLILESVRFHGNPKYGGVVFRRTSPELTGAGSVWEEGREIFHSLGALRESPNLEVRFHGGGVLQFLHLQHAKDVHAHQSKQYAFIGFDELTHFEESQFWYMTSRLRSMSGIRPYMRATCNPDPDSFVRKLIDWWIGEDGYPIPERSGVLRYFIRQGDTVIWADTAEELLPECRPGQRPMSFTFIRSTLEDNPALLEKDPHYRGWLESLPEVDRERLGRGNWNIRPEGGKYIKAEYFTKRWEPNLPPPLNLFICSDYAVTEPEDDSHDPDCTEHGVFGISPTDDVLVVDWWHGQTTSDVWIEKLIDLIAKHKPACVFGEAGVIQKSIEPMLKKRMRERRVYARVEWLSTGTSRLRGVSSKQGFADPSKQAKAARGRAFQARSAMGKVLFPPDDYAPWVRRVIDQCVGFPTGKDDAFDVCAHMCQAIDQAHPGVNAPPPRTPRKRDYGRQRPAQGQSWKTV